MTKTAYLFGEIHGSEIVNMKEFEIWENFYNSGLRHLFLEIPYFEAQFLNIWMESKDDSILNELWRDNEGTAGNSPFDHDFFAKIKLLCPKTIFHGTDIGHAYGTTGKRFLKTVSSDSEEYHFAAENIEQGKKSLAYSMSFRSAEGTLTDSDIDIDGLLAKLKDAFGAELRA